MLFIAIPAYNEVETIGVLLWRLRSVLAEYPREYEVVVFDDASTDGTDDVLRSYTRTLPLTVLRGTARQGYAASLDALLRHVAGRTRHPRRDAILLLQGDFTDPPGIVPEFARRFEGGADIVVGERSALADAPSTVQRLFRYSGWAMRSFVRANGVKDVTSAFRLVRISTVRHLMDQRGREPLCAGDSWTANADLLLNLSPFARRIESVPVECTYGVRMRDTRRSAFSDSLAALKWAWAARKRRPGTLPASGREARRTSGTGTEGRRRRSDGRTESRTNSRVEGKRQQQERRTSTATHSRRKRAGGRRERTEKTGRKLTVVQPDTTEETLSIVDPAAGIAAGLELGARASGSDESGARSEGSPRRKRTRRPRRNRAEDGTSGARSRNGPAAAGSDDGDTIVSMSADGRTAGRSEGRTDVEAGSVPGEDGDAADQERNAKHARRRGRRGRRGGRRVRRTRNEGEHTAEGGPADTAGPHEHQANTRTDHDTDTPAG